MAAERRFFFIHDVVLFQQLANLPFGSTLLHMFFEGRPDQKELQARSAILRLVVATRGRRYDYRVCGLEEKVRLSRAEKDNVKNVYLGWVP